MGNSDSLLTPEHLEELQGRTHFNEKEIKLLLRRYAKLDQSPNGEEGIPLEDFLSMYPFSGNALVRRIAWNHMKTDKHTIHPEGFLLVLSLMCSKADYPEKSKALFDALDVHKEGLIRFEELFRLYKGLFNPALTDAQVTEAVIGALQKVKGQHPGTISYPEFLQMVSPRELNEKMTVDLQLPT